MKKFLSLTFFLVILAPITLNCLSSGSSSNLYRQSDLVLPENEIPEGLSQQEWDSIQGQIEKAEYYPIWHKLTGGHIAVNPRNCWDMIFADGTAEVKPIKGDDWFWKLTPLAYGYEGETALLEEEPDVRTEGSKVEFEYNEDFTAWYINEEGGLEHGFTIGNPPLSVGQGQLTIEMELNTGLIPRIENHNTQITFHSSSGKGILTYTGLKVIDATGQILTSSMSLSPQNSILTFSIDDNGAVYPIVVDPWIFSELKKITASDGAAGDKFYKVAIDGDTLVVGASCDDSDKGSAYVFYQDQGGPYNWGEVKKLTASDGAEGDLFGNRVAISGETIIIAASSNQVGSNINQGCAYIFERNHNGPNNWGEVKILLASDGDASDRFGFDIDIDGDTVVIGAKFEDAGGNNNQGSAYIFQRDHGEVNNWGQVKKLAGSDSIGGGKSFAWSS